MKALITAPGNTAIVTDTDVPEPATNEILVQIHSLGLNPIDPLYTAHPAAPPGRVVGSDIAGTVKKIGEGVTSWRVGDRVAGFLQGATSANYRPGGFAEFAILEADLAIHIPDSVTFEQAATVPLCSLTAAQALFIRLGIDAPFPNPLKREEQLARPPNILIYSASTSVGLLAIELARSSHTPAGLPYRIFATANIKNHAKLLAAGVEAVFDYRSETWPEDVSRASGGISYALDCISEEDSTAKISQTFIKSGGIIAVVRKTAWHKDGVRDDVTPIYSAVWSGLGHEITYNGGSIPASPSWRAFTVEFFRFLSAGSTSNPSRFPIKPIPVRLMPGGLESIVQDAFVLLGVGKVINRSTDEERRSEPWMKPVSGEKLVYHVYD
ncbi:chaperonin 10-like protein [Collybia nuda]|uniref:Chaperonin 10-like protein n=1 Tax=Collybia nuda TaxID=64659 RepID=A0A9P5YE29_9AGAR|nr:chaperonin 10-like protein [Collybia nuda]